MTTVKSYKDLIVWQKSMDLVVAIYKLTELFPQSEAYTLVSQMRRAAISIPSNIAEWSRRGSRKDFRHFLLNAFGSVSELETQIEIAKRIFHNRSLNFTTTDSLLNEISKMINRMASSLQTTNY